MPALWPLLFSAAPISTQLHTHSCSHTRVHNTQLARRAEVSELLSAGNAARCEADGLRAQLKSRDLDLEHMTLALAGRVVGCVWVFVCLLLVCFCGCGEVYVFVCDSLGVVPQPPLRTFGASVSVTPSRCAMSRRSDALLSCHWPLVLLLPLVCVAATTTADEQSRLAALRAQLGVLEQEKAGEYEERVRGMQDLAAALQV